MKQVYLFTAAAVAMLLWVACGGSDDVRVEKMEEVNSVATSSWTKSFRGAIDGKYAILMTLTNRAGSLEGTYEYTRVGVPIKITGLLDDAGGVTMNEFNAEGSMTGIFKGQLQGPNIIGSWEKPDGSKLLSFSVSEQEVSQTHVESEGVTCSEKETAGEEGGEPGIIRECKYRDYMTVTEGYPDYKGRYFYGYTVFKKGAGGKYVEVKNSAIFNSRREDLLAKINARISRDYNQYSRDPEYRDCFEGSSPRTYDFEDLGIEFSQGEVHFHVSFDLSSACLSVDGTTVTLSLEDLQAYL
jgi:hypothetical protein